MTAPITPQDGYCPYCQRTGVAGYRVTMFGFGLGRYGCKRCGTLGAPVDPRKPGAPLLAFNNWMQVEPRRVHGPKGRFQRIAPIGGVQEPVV